MSFGSYHAKCEKNIQKRLFSKRNFTFFVSNLIMSIIFYAWDTFKHKILQLLSNYRQPIIPIHNFFPYIIKKIKFNMTLHFQNIQKRIQRNVSCINKQPFKCIAIVVAHFTATILTRFVYLSAWHKCNANVKVSSPKQFHHMRIICLMCFYFLLDYS